MSWRGHLQGFLLALLASWMVSLASASAQAPPARQPVIAAPAAAPEGQPASEGYVLGANDRLRLIVFGEPTLSGEFAVDDTGKVALPLIGEVVAGGLDVRAFERAIQQRLAEGYLRDPRVSVEVMTGRPFYILGEVTRPGQYPYVTGMSATNAVAVAGGFTPLADQTRLIVKHAGSETEEILPLTPTTVLKPGDTLRVIKGAFFILGEVNAPGEYPYTDGMTALQAVATARGFTYRANRGKVYILRAGQKEEQRLKLVPSLTIEPGDTVRVVERFF